MKQAMFYFIISAFTTWALFAEGWHKVTAAAAIRPSLNVAYPLLGSSSFYLLEPYVTEEGKTCSVESGCLSLVSEKNETNLNDTLGQFNRHSAIYETPVGSQIEFSVREYADGIKVYLQRFINGLSGTNVGVNDDVSTGWPSFRIPNSTEAPGLRFVTPAGNMAGWSIYAQGDAHNEMARFRDGELGGIVVFAQAEGNTYSRSLIMSALTEPMSVNVRLKQEAAELHWGVQGLAEQIPPGYVIEILTRQDNFSTVRNILEWGKALQKYHEVQKVPDFSVDYMSYYTDNGAAYYYNPSPFDNYEDLILSIYSYSTTNNIPFRYIQLDSWWYFKGFGDGVKNWTAMPTVFPNGIEPIATQTGWPIVAHNRYFSNDTDYATQNGGKYSFFIDEYSGKSLPLEKEFWDDLFDDALTWGLITYEQDWLDRQYEGTSALHTNVTLGSAWLNAMGSSALERGITVQYCMALPRQLLHSVQLPAVTQIRVSDDYLLAPDQWNIGISSLFVHALGLKPFRDVFWTSNVNENVIYNDCQSVSSGYTGYKNETGNGVPCVDWKDFGYDALYPNSIMRMNLCRNPDYIMSGAFCYTKASFDLPEDQWTKDYCDPPVCNVDCYTFTGVDYEGDYGMTERGLLCADWNGDYGLQGSVCRNPTNENKPWCYTNSLHSERDFCDNKCAELQEVNPALKSAISTLSTGPVGVGDRIKNLNPTLISRSCNADGLLLKPSIPLMVTDEFFLMDSGEIWTSQSVVSNNSFGILFSALLDSNYTLSPLKLNLETALSRDFVYWQNYPQVLGQLEVLPADSSIHFYPSRGYMDFFLHYTSPIFNIDLQKITVLGELSKWAPISPQRIISILEVDGVLEVKVNGASKEEVIISFWSNMDGVFNVHCNFQNKTSLAINSNTKICS